MMKKKKKRVAQQSQDCLLSSVAIKSSYPCLRGYSSVMTEVGHVRNFGIFFIFLSPSVSVVFVLGIEIHSQVLEEKNSKVRSYLREDDSLL